MKHNNALKALESTPDHLIVGNYLALFGGRDLENERFTPDTEFESAYTKADTLAVDWEHGMMTPADGEPGRDDVLGRVNWATAKADDKGLFVQRVLDRRNKYVQYLESLIEEGVIGTSSEAVASQVRKASDGTIERWPLKRDTLTVTPMEPRMMNENVIQALKALGDMAPAFKAAHPELFSDRSKTSDQRDDRTPSSVTVATGDAEDYEIVHEDDTDMSEQKEAKAAPAFDATPILDAIKGVGEQVGALNERVTAIEADGAEAKAYRDKAVANGVGVGKAADITTARKTPLGDTFPEAFKHWLKSGDGSGLYMPPGSNEYDLAGDEAIQASGSAKAIPTHLRGDARKAWKASNATDLNIGTAADGGDLVPTGFHNMIIARRDQADITTRLNVMQIPGTGNTTDVPVDNEADGEFVSTSEAGTFDQDAPAVAKKSLTLVYYTKRTLVSYQLLNATGVNLLGFLSNFVGRGLAKTRNNLLLTEVAANGTNFTSFASATAIAFGELEDIAYNNDLHAYLDDPGSVAWVMRAPTFSAIAQIVGNDRQYVPFPDGTLLGYPVEMTDKAAAIASTAKSVYFGNWNYVGVYENPGITFVRDPYTNAGAGQIRLLWHIGIDYAALQPEAIGYADQAA